MKWGSVRLPRRRYRFQRREPAGGLLAADRRRSGLGAIYALVAVGYTLVFGLLRLINFAHSEIFMLGMFGAYFCLDVILGFTPVATPTTAVSH